MKKPLIFLVLFVCMQALHAAEYKADWNYSNFYEAVNMCRGVVIFPAATDYEKKGLASNKSKEVLRNEIIATMPVFESIATDVCYCAINEYAKDYLHSDFIKDTRMLASYMETPRCKSKLVNSINGMKDKAGMLKLQ